VKQLILILAILCLALPAAARTGASNSLTQEEAILGEVDEILLRDGTVLSGTIVEEDDGKVVIDTESLGRITVERSRIKEIVRKGASHGLRVDPDRNSILLTPTCETLPKGDHYFRSFELLFLNYGYAITDDLNLSLAAFFPVSTEWNFLATGVKWRLLDRKHHTFGLAMTASHLIAPDDQRFTTIGCVGGFGNARRSLNVAFDYGYDEDGDGGQRLMVGGDVQISRKLKLFAEWMDTALIFEAGDDDDEFNGFINLGFRIFGESMAFTLGAFRPLSVEGGGFVGVPMMMFSAHW
jgi:hypothetical protein